MVISNARKAVITDVSIIDGEVRCDLEDLHQNKTPYKNVPIEKPVTGEIIVPEVGTKAILRPMYGNRPIITGFLDIPSTSFSDEQAVEDGAAADENSVAFSLGNDGEKVTFERTSSGYNVSVDVNGNVNIAASGDIVIDQGDLPKKVLTEDAVFEYEDTGDTGDGSASPQTKTTTTVSNGEVTSTEID